VVKTKKKFFHSIRTKLQDNRKEINLNSIEGNLNSGESTMFHNKWFLDVIASISSLTTCMEDYFAFGVKFTIRVTKNKN
jgi:hypothetical protein